jgi:DNA primase small subunit
MSRREFSFTLEHDIYIRYLSFRNVAEMEAAIKSKCPHKIDIGALYNVEVSFGFPAFAGIRNSL